MTVTQLAAALRDRGAGPPGADASTELAIELRHVHLPMLADAGVIAYDRDDGTVQRGRRFAGVRSLLRAIDRHQANASNARS